MAYHEKNLLLASGHKDASIRLFNLNDDSKN